MFKKKKHINQLNKPLTLNLKQKPKPKEILRLNKNTKIFISIQENNSNKIENTNASVLDENNNESDQIILLLQSKIDNKDILDLAITIYNRLEKNQEISTDIFNSAIGSSNSLNIEKEEIEKYVYNNTDRDFINEKFREIIMGNQLFYRIYKKNNKFIKLYRYNDFMNYVNLILEITFQIYSYNILKLCSTDIELTTSKILKCYKINTTEINEYKNMHRNIFYIEMDMVEDGILLQDIKNNIKNNKCTSFVRLIHYLDDCLKTHGIYHNDLNPGNIFLSTNANGNIVKITIIDFGQSLDKLNGPSKVHGIINYNCNTNSKLKMKRLKNMNTNFSNV
jgi:hypothetical protein